MKTSPWLKNQSDADREARTSRSRLRTESSRRQSTSPSRNTAQNASQTAGLLIVVPPKAPLEPRAMRQATWGPVHASVTAPVRSSTVPVAISPAAPDQTFTVQRPASYVASVVGFFG